MELKRFSWVWTACSNWAFSSHPEYLFVRKAPKEGPQEMLSQWSSKQHLQSSSTFQRDTTHKKTPPFNKMHAQVSLSAGSGACSTHRLSWKRGPHAPGTDCHRHLHKEMNSSRAHSPPQETHGNPTPYTDKQLKTLLDDQYQNPISLRKGIQETYTGREL